MVDILSVMKILSVFELGHTMTSRVQIRRYVTVITDLIKTKLAWKPTQSG